MKKLSKSDENILIKQFYESASWAHDCWALHRFLFDDNNNKENTIGKFKCFSKHLSIITQEYCLIQIAKLHDPSHLNESLNATIKTVFDIYNGKNKKEVKNLRDQLSGFWSKIKPARNKILAHNDFVVYKTNKSLGEFQKDLDKKYFETLEKFSNIIFKASTKKEPPGFNASFIESDVSEFLKECSQTNQSK